MICPSCSETLNDEVRHCIHCGIGINRRSVLAAAVINNFGWVARRSLGGYFAGATGCVMAIAVARTMSFAQEGAVDFSRLLEFFPGQAPFPAAIAGCFVGSVGGMIERSTYKAILGGLLGGFGGAIAGMMFPFFQNAFKGHMYGYSLSMAAAWAIIGGMAGLTSGILESTRTKILAGIAGGVAGGILGGGLGSQMYGAMLMEVAGGQALSWGMGRLLEFGAGGIVGVNVWFFTGLAEKLIIFKRRQLKESDAKVCDQCQAENTLRAWYCAQCGAALQVAAKRDQIRVTPFRGLERVSNAFQFLSWLAATAGVVMSLVVFLLLLSQNFLFALFGALLVALVIYIVSITFRAISDSLRAGIQITERLSREQPSR